MSEILLTINVLMTSGVLVVLIGAAVRYGRLEQRVEDHHERLGHIEDQIYGRNPQ